MDQFIESLQDKVHNRKWWTARWLHDLSTKTEIDEDTLSKAIAGVVFVICACTKQARLVCNSILIAVPLIFTFGYPKEAASKDEMVIYWGCFGVLTICDTGFEKVPLYYDIKLLLALLLFVDPPKYINVLKELINGKNTEESRIFNKNEMDTLLQTHSPRPEKPSDSAGKRATLSGRRKGESDAGAEREHTGATGKDRESKNVPSERTRICGMEPATTEPSGPPCSCEPGSTCKCKNGRPPCVYVVWTLSASASHYACVKSGPFASAKKVNKDADVTFANVSPDLFVNAELEEDLACVNPDKYVDVKSDRLDVNVSNKPLATVSHCAHVKAVLFVSAQTVTAAVVTSAYANQVPSVNVRMANRRAPVNLIKFVDAKSERMDVNALWTLCVSASQFAPASLALYASVRRI
ncbi:unnamed protein product [Cylicocyclus nassatus]|uniref:Uncharacterized protein n=1 Tax=Cylicocyclus nassatus TaxID=53992 RepID=A0AA36H526_CYLNA|nr:unnamed protein product [Cylicocyclus nassatus]